MAVPKLTPIQQTSPIVLPSTGTYSHVTTSLPYGIYNGSSDFISGAADQVALTYKMLGGDILDIELSSSNVYASYELATLEYSYIVNNHQAKNVLSSFFGATTGTFDHDGNLKSGELSSSLDGSQASLKFPKFTFEYSKRVFNGLARGAGLGDSRTYSASISLNDNQQDYDLQEIVQSASIDGTTAFGYAFTGSIDNKRIEIRRVYYRSPSTMWRFYGYYGGLNVVGNLFTYGQYSDESTFEVVPAWQNKLQAMAFETNLYTRASFYSYEIRDNRIRVYPPPVRGGGSPDTMWFEFTVPENAWSEESSRKDGTDGVNNYNTLPFANIPFENINSMGKQWIRKYGLAISKEMLAQVRGKFTTVPIPGDSVTLNAAELTTQAKEEQEKLKTELKELLDTLTYATLAEQDAKTAEDANRINVVIPMGIYRG